MCCHTLTGKAFIPFIILKQLQNVPAELKEFIDHGLIHLASSPSGWQTRDTFIYWALCLINEMSFYRKTLSRDIRNKEALLIMDGHSSRECPFGLALLRDNKIDVLILPAHSTHVMQIFDVAIASPLKTYYSTALKKYLHDLDDVGPAAPKVRHAVVESFISAWSAACTYKNCQNGGIKTGTSPLDFEEVCKSPFVGVVQEDEGEPSTRKTTRLNINEKIITSPHIMVEIDNEVSRFDRFAHLLLRNKVDDYQANATKIIENSKNGCRLLSKLPPFITEEDRIIYFD